MHLHFLKRVAALLLVALLSLLPTLQAQALDRPIRVAFFNPHHSDDPFWATVEGVMRAAAADLEIELTTHVAGHDRAKMIDQVRTVVSASDKPDFIVFKNFKGNAPQLIQIAELYGVKSFLFNAGLTQSERLEHGGPREHYRHWIGQMLPDDTLAGYTLASTLIARARTLGLTNNDGQIAMAGLTGNPSDSAAIERNKGLERALEENPDVAFRQLAPARWDRAQGALKTLGLFRRYADIAVLWAANDPMALGAIDAAQQVGLTPGQDFIVGGIDWNAPALQAVADGSLETTIGGHFMEGGWVMVLLHDYAHGYDFALDGGTTRYSQMASIRRDNLDKYLNKFINADWNRVDFTTFSMANNPALKSYDFSLERILDPL